MKPYLCSRVMIQKNQFLCLSLNPNHHLQVKVEIQNVDRLTDDIGHVIAVFILARNVLRCIPKDKPRCESCPELKV